MKSEELENIRQDTRVPLERLTRVLLVACSLADRHSTGNLLQGQSRSRFTVDLEDDIANVLLRVKQGNFDVILLDLGLPCSQGLETVNTLLEQVPDLPLVVLTGADDEELGDRALALGAQDFVTETPHGMELLLTRSLRHAIERHRLLQRLRQAEMLARREAELDVGYHTALAPDTPITAELFGLKPLKDAAVDEFQRLVTDYQYLLNLSLEQQVYRVQHPVSPGLTEIVDRVGYFRGGPRYLLLEFMGKLPAYYRRFYLGNMGVTAGGRKPSNSRNTGK